MRDITQHLGDRAFETAEVGAGVQFVQGVQGKGYQLSKKEDDLSFVDIPGLRASLLLLQLLDQAEPMLHLQKKTTPDIEDIYTVNNMQNQSIFVFFQL